MSVSPAIHQITIVLSSQLAALSVGGAVTYPTLLMQRFRDNDTSLQQDMETKSWIGSIYGLAGIPAILMPVITQKIGRKWGYIITCLCLMLGWILTFSATTTTELLISESFHGLGTNSLLPVSFLGMTEMLPPKYRAPSMQTFGIAQGIGMAACGILGRYLHYKTVSIIMLIPIVIAIAIALVWPESPSWFAWRGEFEKCERAFVKLRGTDDVSKKELRDLIRAQREILSYQSRGEAMVIKMFWRKISSRDFYMSSFHVFVLFLMMYWSGCDVIYIYFIEIIAKSSQNNDAAFYAGIAMYLIVLGGLVTTNVLVRKFKNKTVLAFSTCGVIIFLLFSCLISGLQSMNLLSENSLLLMCSLIGYMACASLGLNGIVFFIAAELMPVKHRSLSGALYIIINCILYASSLKLSPYISLYLGLWCTFLIYAINATVCMWFIWKHVPETKGKSLLEIENYYNIGCFSQRYVNDNSVYNDSLVTENTC